MLQNWEGRDGVCYKDIDEFISSMPEDDDAIDIRIHCRGGDCVEAGRFTTNCAARRKQSLAP